MKPEEIVRVGEKIYSESEIWIQLYTSGSLEPTMVPEHKVPEDPVGKKIHFKKTGSNTWGVDYIK